MKFPTILLDPPWKMKKAGRYQGGGRNEKPRSLPYQSMDLHTLAALPIRMLAEEGCHIWCWTVDELVIRMGWLFDEWGLKYHAPIVWSKPSGFGNYLLHQTEFLLFAYHGKFTFNKARYIPNRYELDEMPQELVPADSRYTWPRAKAGEHSRKPEGAFELIESISEGPYLEIFARPAHPLFPQRANWTHIGDQFDGHPIERSIAALIRDEWPLAA